MATFPLRTILTVTTGRLLTESKGEGNNGIGDLYTILTYLTGDAPFAHQLGRFAKECKPYLYQCFPELTNAEACLDKLDELVERSATGPEDAISIWLAELKTAFPNIKEEYALTPMPTSDHKAIDPMDELFIMMQK